MTKMMTLLFLFLGACSQQNMTPVGKTYQSDIDGIKTSIAFHPEGNFSGSMVNSYFGLYRLKDQSIQLNLQGTTMMGRTPPEREAEEQYFHNLDKITTFQINENNLILKGPDFEYTFIQSNSN